MQLFRLSALSGSETEHKREHLARLAFSVPPVLVPTGPSNSPSGDTVLLSRISSRTRDWI